MLVNRRVIMYDLVTCVLCFIDAVGLILIFVQEVFRVSKSQSIVECIFGREGNTRNW